MVFHNNKVERREQIKFYFKRLVNRPQPRPIMLLICPETLCVGGWVVVGKWFGGIKLLPKLKLNFVNICIVPKSLTDPPGRDTPG